MRTLTESQQRALEDLSAQGLLGGLPLQTAEKDIHITDVLDALSNLQVSHRFFKGLRPGEASRTDDGIQLIFAGGTCLSKAHQLIARMSEDIDIKVVLSPSSTALSRDTGHRARLKALHLDIEKAVAMAGFEIPATMDGEANPRIRNARRHYVLAARYGSTAPKLTTLRPELKLEVIHRHPRLPTQHVSFGYMFEAMAGLDPSRQVSMPCLHVAETLAEKVLSLLRRCHGKWSGQREDDMDPALVRHVYDVHCIMQQQPQQLALAATIFKSLVAGEIQEFANRDPAFEQDPRAALGATLAQARSSDELRARYADHLLPLIYQGEDVAYTDALASFEDAAAHLLACL